MPVSHFGSFVAEIPRPPGIGTVALELHRLQAGAVIWRLPDHVPF